MMAVAGAEIMHKIACPSCDESLPRSARFCRRCGKPVERVHIGWRAWGLTEWTIIACSVGMIPLAFLLAPDYRGARRPPPVASPAAPPSTAKQRVPPGFTYIGPAPSVPDASPGRAQDALAQQPSAPLPSFASPPASLRELPADELWKLEGTNGSIGPGLEGLHGPQRYFSCTIRNGSAWFVASVKIRVTLIGQKGELSEFDLERQMGAAPAASRSFTGRLDEPLRPGEWFVWGIVAARGWPQAPR